MSDGLTATQHVEAHIGNDHPPYDPEHIQVDKLKPELIDRLLVLEKKRRASLGDGRHRQQCRMLKVWIALLPDGTALSKVQSVDQRMRLECGVGFRQLRTCRRTRPGQLCATSGPIRQVCLQILSTLLHPPITIDRAAALSRNCRLVGPVEMDTIYSLRDRGGCHARSTKRH